MAAAKLQRAGRARDREEGERMEQVPKRRTSLADCSRSFQASRDRRGSVVIGWRWWWWPKRFRSTPLVKGSIPSSGIKNSSCSREASAVALRFESGTFFFFNLPRPDPIFN